MSELTKKINQFFKEATKSEILKINDEIYFTEHLQNVYEMFYLKHKDIDFIAYTLNCSRSKIDGDLKQIRKQLNKLI